MLIVRGGTLQSVRGILEADGTDAQLTEVTDGVLSQVVDVTRAIPGLGAADGWALLRETMDHAVTGDLFTTENVYTLIETLGGSRLTHRAWLMAVSAYGEIVGGNTIVEATVGVSYPVIANVSAGGVIAVQKWEDFDTMPITAAATHAAGSPQWDTPLYPMVIQPGGLILSASESTVAAGNIEARIELLVWMGRIGLNPPGVA